MTTPISHGHPDWGRTIAATDIQVIRVTHVQAAVEDDLGTFFVGNMPYFWVRMLVNNGGAKLVLSWMDAATGGNVIATNEVHTRVTITATGPFAVLGPWVQITSLTDVIPRTITVNAWQSLAGGQEVTPDLGNILISQNGTAIGAGATSTYNPIRARWGWGYWSARIESSASTRILLLAVDYLGAVQLLDYTAQGDTAPGRLILLPPMPIRITAFNNDASIRSVYAVVLAHPGPL
jgi:hypothetical protein